MTCPYREKWQSDCGNVTLYLGDCLEILPTLGKVDCVVTDPPYGIAHKSHGQHFRGHEMINGDDDTGHAEAIREWAELREICCVMFFSPYRPLHGWRSVLAWIKGGHVGIGGDRETCWKRDFELIGVERNGPLSGNRDNAVLVGYNALSPPPSGHAHEKPVELVEYLLRKVGGDVICDPCCGSGTTGVACVRLGRKFIGIEIEDRYYDIAKRRLKDELAKSRILDPPERKPTQKRLVD